MNTLIININFIAQIHRYQLQVFVFLYQQALKLIKYRQLKKHTPDIDIDKEFFSSFICDGYE